MFFSIRDAWRSWKSTKGVAIFAILAFAIGIGSTTAIYTAVHAVLLKPLPYRHEDRLVALYAATLVQPKQRSALTYPDLVAFQQKTHSFEMLGWFTTANYNLSSPGSPRQISAVKVTPQLVAGLGVNPTFGRWFREPGTDPAGADVAVLSNALWNGLGSDPGIVGKHLVLDGRPFTVLGVMPRWFKLPMGSAAGEQNRGDLWVPLDPRQEQHDTQSGYYLSYARLKPGVTLAAAQADVARTAAEIGRADPANHPSFTARLDPLHAAEVSEIRPVLLLLFAASAILLLITCANVSGLLVARAVSRTRETAVRVALGASAWQLAIGYFYEGLLVSVAGALLGILVSVALVRAVVSLAASYIPRAGDVHLDPSVLGFVVLAAVVSSLLASLAPLVEARRTQPNEALGDGSRSSTGRRGRRLSQALVIAEIGLAFTLLGVSAFLASQLRSLLRLNPGFQASHVFTFDLTAAGAPYSALPKLAAYQNSLLDSLGRAPGVESVAFTNQVPLEGCCLSTTLYPEPRPNGLQPGLRVSFLPVSPDYLRTLKIPLLDGRFLDARDTAEEPLRAVVNQAAAVTFWPHRRAVGSYGRVGQENGSRFAVIGVVGDIKNAGLDEPTVPEIYFSSALVPVNPMRFLLRSALPAETVAREVRSAVLHVNPGQPVAGFLSLEAVVRDSLQLGRASSFLTAFFALAALLMAALGIYGVVAYSVRQRIVELGTRLALGAQPRDLLRLVVGGGLRMAGAGTAFGCLATGLAVALLLRQGTLHEFAAAPFAGSIVAIVAIASLASLFPAWRATRLSPVVAIRNEPGSMWLDVQRSIRELAAGVAGSFPRLGNAPALEQAMLLTRFVESARAAQTVTESVHLSLLAVRDELQAEFAALLEKAAEGNYTCIDATSPDALVSCSVPGDGVLVGRLRAYHEPLPLEERNLTAWAAWAREQRPRHLPELETLLRARVRLAIPVRTRNDITGLLLVGAPAGRAEYSAVEKEALAQCAGQFALMLENGRLTTRIVEQEKLRRDLAMAAEVQRRLLPENSPVSTAVAFAAFSLPARTVGGDYYDFLPAGEHRIAIALADVAGKGIAAALIMSVVQASLRILSAEGDIPLPELVSRLNRFLHRSTGVHSYATFFYAQLDESNRRLRYVNAGHNPPYLLRSVAAQLAGAQNAASSPRIEELSTGGMIIGMFSEARYEEGIVDLQPGDLVAAFTDGVTEAMSPDEEEFGEERLKAVLSRTAHLPVEEMAEQIKGELRAWIRDAPQHDDLTFVAMKVR